MTLVALALAWIGAIAMVATWSAPWWLPAGSIAALAPVAARRWLPLRTPLTLALAVSAAIAGLHFENWDTRPLPGLTAHAGEEVVLEGKVASLPDPGRTVTRYRVDVDRITTSAGTVATSGAVLVTVSQYASYERGTPVRVQGQLDTPPTLGDFDYRAFLLRRGIAATMFMPAVEVTGSAGWSPRHVVDSVRMEMERTLQRALPEPEASLAAGITLGRDDGISTELYTAYRQSGLAHIIAVSGSNLAIVAGIVFFAVTPLAGRNRAVIPAVLAVSAYLLLAGGEWPVIRAWVMALVFLGGAWMGRQEAGLAALGAAAIIMTAIAPGAAREVSFQLSLAATAGIIVFAPWARAGVSRVARACRIDGLVPALAERVIGMSLAATVATLPLAWVNFGEISLVGPLANVLGEPLFVLAFGLSLLVGVAGAAWEPAGWLAGLVAYYPLAGCTWLATTLSRPDASSITVARGSAGWAAGAYVALSAVGWFAYRYPAPIEERLPVRGASLVVRRAAVAMGAGVLATLVVRTSLLPMGGPGALELAMLDVGQGDALLLTTPGGKRILVDGGPSGIETAQELSSQLPHWERNLDAVILTHPQQDHLGGLAAVFDRYNADEIYESGATNSTEAFAAYREGAGSWRTLVTGDRFEFDGVHFEVLWPDAGDSSRHLNNRSLVLLVTYGSTSILLTGDIEAEAQAALLERGPIAIDVLKVPHHGSRTSSMAFLTGTGAGLALISAGADNPFGHPAEFTLRALQGMPVYRTDVDGRIVVRSDGERIEVSTEH